MGRKKKPIEVESDGTVVLNGQEGLDRLKAIGDGFAEKAEQISNSIEDRVKILKAEIKDETLYAEYTERKGDGTTDTIKKESEHLVHADLKAKFRELVPHMIVICDQKGSDECEDAINDDVAIEEYLHEEYSVVGYQLKGDDVVISGHKHLEKRGGSMKIKAVEVNLQGAYEYANQLSLAIEACNYEVKEYLFNGKYAVKQQEMEFPEEAHEEETAEAE